MNLVPPSTVNSWACSTTLAATQTTIKRIQRCAYVPTRCIQVRMCVPMKRLQACAHAPMTQVTTCRQCWKIRDAAWMIDGQEEDIMNVIESGGGDVHDGGARALDMCNDKGWQYQTMNNASTQEKIQCDPQSEHIRVRLTCYVGGD